MPVKPSEARQLCTAAELKLVNQSYEKVTDRHTPRQISARIGQARKLRDKFSKLAKTQQREARGKADPRGKRPSKSNQRTVRKVELFDETITRFEQQLEKLQKDSSNVKASTTKQPARKKQTSKKKSTAKKSAQSSKSADTSAPQAPLSATSKPQASVSQRKPSNKPAAKSRSQAQAAPLLGFTGLGSPSFGSGGLSGSLTGSAIGATPALTSRQQRRRAKSTAATLADQQSHFAATGQRKIQTHTAATVRRAQARRDAKG